MKKLRRLHNKRSQVAMEFLMNYGWAILAAFVAIGGLAYFGAFNPQNLLPYQCDFETGLHCNDVSIKEDGVAISLTNTLGRPIEIDSVKFPIGSEGVSCSYKGEGMVMAPGETLLINTTEKCLILKKGEKKVVKPEISYTSLDSGLERKVEGHIRTD